jgi:predicted dehydrogenase
VDTYFDVVALVSNGGPESAAWSAYHYPLIGYHVSLSDALALPSIDAVFLATPTPTHAALTCQALEAGCHVFVEKPLALEPAGAARAVSMAEQHRLEIFIGYVYLFHGGFSFIRSAVRAESIRSLRFDWVRPDLKGSLHGELLCHDLAVMIALTGELPARAVVLESSNRLLHCRIELPSGRTCESTMQLRDDVMKRRVVEVGCADGAAYTWHDDHIHAADDPGTNMLEPESGDPLSREIMAFRSAIDGTGPRMIDDQRLSIGIARLLHDVDMSSSR